MRGREREKEWDRVDASGGVGGRWATTRRGEGATECDADLVWRDRRQPVVVLWEACNKEERENWVFFLGSFGSRFPANLWLKFVVFERWFIGGGEVRNERKFVKLLCSWWVILWALIVELGASNSSWEEGIEVNILHCWLRKEMDWMIDFWQRKRIEGLGMYAKCHGRVRKKENVMEVVDYGSFYFSSFYFCDKNQKIALLFINLRLAL